MLQLGSVMPAQFNDENSSAEGQFAVNVLNDLSRRTGALVIACDHFGKMIDTGTTWDVRQGSVSRCGYCLSRRNAGRKPK
jgi:hypothetical protein